MFVTTNFPLRTVHVGSHQRLDVDMMIDAHYE